MGYKRLQLLAFILCISRTAVAQLCDSMHCLRKHIEILRVFDEKNKHYTLINFSRATSGFDLLSKYRWKNDIVQVCAKVIERSSTIAPLFDTWDFIKKMDIQDDNILLIREYSLLIFYLYEEIIGTLVLKNQDATRYERSTFRDIVLLYNIVADLPIKELIVALEKCYLVFSRILKDYGASSDMTWKAWFQKYWWVLPTITLAVLAGVLRRTSYRPSSFMRPSTSMRNSGGDS